MPAVGLPAGQAPARFGRSRGGRG